MKDPTPITKAEVLPLIPEDESSFLHQYVLYGAERGESPVIYHVANAFGLLAAVAPTTLCVDSLPGGRIFANWWCMISGRPALDRKTTSIKYAADVAYTSIPKHIGPEPVNWEGLRESLVGNQVQLVLVEEMGDFFGRMEAAYAAPLKSNLLKMFDCAPVHYRTARKEIKIPTPRISFVGAANPSVISQHVTPQDWESGFMSRWAIFYSHREDEKLIAPPNHERLEWLGARLQDRMTSPCGKCLGLDADGTRLWVAWNRDLNRRLGDASNLTAVAAYGRTAVHMIKMAMLLSFDDAPEDDWYIPVDHLDRAIGFAELHYRSSILLSEMSHSSKDMRERAAVLRSIGEGWTTYGDVLKQSQVLKMRGDALIETLLEQELIEFKVVNGRMCYRKTADAFVDDVAVPEADDILGIARGFSGSGAEA